ncbi:MAG: glycosyltransferase family 2 protein [Anaerolineaceae bacterium]|nr:MAG: glycosyltransferase family 2 protein [Anaerolineaceae bacterium]
MSTYEILTGFDRNPITERDHRELPAPAKASIIIVNYNGLSYLSNCLHSVQATCDDDVEIIIVDNNSTDGSAEQLVREFPDIWLIRSDENIGFGSGNNIGTRQASGEYVVFLNPDTVVTPGWLDPLIRVFEEDPEVGIATSKILLLREPDQINTCGNNVHISGITICRGLRLDKKAMSAQANVGAASGCAFVMRRDLFWELGGYDDDFFLYMEDTDLSWRAQLAGFRCVYVPDSVVYHDYALRFGPEKTYYQERNRYLMLLKNLHWRTLLLLMPVLLLAELVTWGFVIVREQKHLMHKPRALWYVIRRWRSIMAKRQEVQELRKGRDRDLLVHCTTSLEYDQTGPGPAAWFAGKFIDPLFSLWYHFIGVFAGW